MSLTEVLAIIGTCAVLNQILRPTITPLVNLGFFDPTHYSTEMEICKRRYQQLPCHYNALDYTNIACSLVHTYAALKIIKKRELSWMCM